jgi:phosphatidylethanolamine/phosphatidyl-N-methylethanolamine N-methyltransferase
MSAVTFLKEFSRNWKTVGAVAPSSPALAERMMVAADVGKARHILELGPGTGALTMAIQEARSKDSSYLGIEINPTFACKLRERFKSMSFEVAGAQEFDFASYLSEREPIDVIISGLPWTAFPRGLQEAILGNVLPHLAPSGRFATFAYYGFHLMPSGQRFRSLLHDRLPGVETSRVVWGNVPPAFVYVGRK